MGRRCQLSAHKKLARLKRYLKVLLQWLIAAYSFLISVWVIVQPLPTLFARTLSIMRHNHTLRSTLIAFKASLHFFFFSAIATPFNFCFKHFLYISFLFAFINFFSRFHLRVSSRYAIKVLWKAIEWCLSGNLKWVCYKVSSLQGCLNSWTYNTLYKECMYIWV